MRVNLNNSLPACSLAPNPSGGPPSAMPIRFSSFCGNSSHESEPSAHAVRCSEPKVLIRSGISDPCTFSKSRAGPPALVTRSVISVISSSGFTCAEMRCNSPLASRNVMNSRRSLNVGGICSVRYSFLQCGMPQVSDLRFPRASANCRLQTRAIWILLPSCLPHRCSLPLGG